MKNNFIKCEITEIGVKEHFAEAFFGAHNVHQDIKYINFIYGEGEKGSIKSHDHIEAYTEFINSPIYGKSNNWNKYYFLQNKNNKKYL